VTLLARARSFLAAFFRRRRVENEMDEEWRFHLDARVAALEADGRSHADAERQARKEFGDPLRWREQGRDARGLRWIEDAAADIRYAVRQMRRSPGFALVIIVTLALGIGANTAVFTIANAVLFRSLPFDKPDRIVYLDTADATGRSLGVSLQDFDDWRRASRTFSAMALVFSPGLNLAGDDHLPEQYPGSYISVAGFDLIGQKAAVGRSFREDDDRIGAPAVVILSDSLWRSRYGADPSVIGRTINVSTLACTVIGVMPPGFAFPFDDQVWVPMSQLAPVFRDRGRQARFFRAYGRVTDGATIEQARAELAAISGQLHQQYPVTNKDATATVTPFLEWAIGAQFRTLSWLLLGAVTFVLLIACSNVANLLLARSANRAREIALRVSLGASRGRIIRQLLVESLLLSCIGGLAGLEVAAAGVRWFDANLQEVGRPSWMNFTLDAHVVTFFAAIVVLTGILFGMAPAVHISKTDANGILKEGGRSGTGGIGARRWTGVLIVSELTLTLLLLSGAGLMTRSFLKLYNMDVGFDTSNLLTLRLVLPARKYPTFDTVMAFIKRVDDQLATVTAIKSASTATNVPMLIADSGRLLIREDEHAADATPPPIMMASIGPRYFETLGVHLIRGRQFDDYDGRPGREVAIVNLRLADTFFPNEDPIGKQISIVDDLRAGRQSPWATIVGVAPTIRQRAVKDAPNGDPFVYIPNIQHLAHRNGTMVLVRGKGDPTSLTAQLRREIAALDPDLPLSNISMMDEVLAQRRWPARVFGTMFGAFAIIALALAGVGLYALMAHAVTQRTAEIGVRRALGAPARHIVWIVARRVVAHLTLGLALGLAGAIVGGRLLASELVETRPTDPPTLLITSAILILAAALACLPPLRRAITLDPVIALHYE
jgi:putative ABC transport system permease protein